MNMNEMPPAIRYWLKRQGAPQTTVSWITKDGEEHSITGRVAGWARTPKGTPCLTVEVHQNNQGPARYDKKHIANASLQRWLDQLGVDTRPLPAVERCEECGKTMGSGRIGHLDGTVVPGLCFNCA